MPTARVTTTKPAPVKVSAPAPKISAAPAPAPIRVVTGQRDLGAEQAAREQQIALQQAIAQEKAKEAADATYRARVEEATQTAIRNQTEMIRQASIVQARAEEQARAVAQARAEAQAQVRSQAEIARTNAEINDAHAIHVVESPAFIGPQQQGGYIKPEFIPSPKTQEYITPASLYGEPTAKINVPLIPGVGSFIGGVIPLTAGSFGDVNAYKTVNQNQYEPTLEGFKPQTTQARAEALDISEKVLSQEILKSPEVVTYTQIPAVGKPTTETRTYKDPATGLTVTDTITTTPQGGVQENISSSESITTTKGIKPVKSDLSNPLGSFFSGARDTSVNELIGVKNIGAIVVGKEQEEQYATPLAVAFGGLFEAGSIIASDIGGSVFDLGRSVARKAPVQVGQQVSTFGIGGDQITIEQKPRQGFEKAVTVASEAKLRAERLIEADPFYALGEAAVQVPLLFIAPVKAVSVALKGIGVAAKVAKGASVAVKAVAKGEKVIPALGKSKLFSITGEAVTEVKPKTSFASSYPEEYGLGEAKAIQAEDIAKFGELTPERQAALNLSQRGQFEQGVGRLQEGKYAIGETTAEYTESGLSKTQKNIEKLRTTRITSEEISPALGAKIKELEKTGSQADLFPQKPVRATADDILNPGFTSTKIDLGTGLGRFEKGGEGLFGDTGKVLPPTPPSGVRTVGDVVDATAKVQGISRAEARRLLEETGTIPPSISDKAVLKGGYEAGAFTSTEAGLGRGTGSYLGDIGKVSEEGGYFGESASKITKITDEDITKFSKTAKIPKDDAEKLLKKSYKNDLDTGSSNTQVLLQEPERVAQVAQNTQKLFELEKARTALKKTNANKAISSIEDQATQRKLSDLIKEEKLKKPSTSADLATQKALRKLIEEEKAKIAAKTTAQKLDEGIDILRAKPRGLVAESEGIFDQSFRKPGGKLGVGAIGGIATGVVVGSSLGLGLDFDQMLKPPKVTQDFTMFQPQVTKQVKDPLISITRQFQQQPQIIKEIPKLKTRQEVIQTPSQRFTEIFKTPTKTTTPTIQTTKKTTKQITDIFQEQQQKTTTTTEETGFPPGLGFGFPRGGGGDVVPSGKGGRKFYRVFDIAKTPFGRIEYGLGAQVQSETPIYEFSDVIPPKKKGSKNANEQFFSL